MVSSLEIVIQIQSKQLPKERKKEVIDYGLWFCLKKIFNNFLKPYFPYQSWRTAQLLSDGSHKKIRWIYFSKFPFGHLSNWKIFLPLLRINFINLFCNSNLCSSDILSEGFLIFSRKNNKYKVQQNNPFFDKMKRSFSLSILRHQCQRFLYFTNRNLELNINWNKNQFQFWRHLQKFIS